MSYHCDNALSVNKKKYALTHVAVEIEFALARVCVSMWSSETIKTVLKGKRESRARSPW